MSKYDASDVDNCFVCGEYMGSFKSELTEVTSYSEKTIFQLIELFTTTDIPKTVAESGGICQNCFIKFNEYDEHQTLANQILSELSSMLAIRESYVDCKADIKHEEIIFDEYDETSVEVNEKYIIIEEVVQDDSKINDDPIVEAKQLGEKKRSSYVKKDKDAGFLITMINNQKHYTCDFCNKHFLSRSRLRTHRQIHSTVRNYMCNSCGSKFKTLNCLKNHARLHSNVYYFCDLCDGRFKGKHELKCHIEAIHLGRKDHVCQICGKAFSRDKTLRQHLLYHYNERNIVCEICGYKTINKPKMTRHLKSHSGQRDYACSICGKRFLYSYNVTAHIKHVHWKQQRPTTSEEKLLCSICGKKFQKIWRVREHMKEVHKIEESEIKDEKIEILR